MCVSAGYLASYYNRPIFPEYCSDAIMDDKGTFNTMVRVAGTWTGLGRAFSTVMRAYGWHHAVILSDTVPNIPCTLGATAINGQLSLPGVDDLDAHWIRMKSTPNNAELNDYLLEVQDRGRGNKLRVSTVRNYPTDNCTIILFDL